MRLKSLLVITIAISSQIANIAIARADSRQIERLIADAHSERLPQRSLANSLALNRNMNTDKNIPTIINPFAEHLNLSIARSKPKFRKPANRPQPQPITTTPAANEPANAPKQVLISDIIIKTDRGQLDPTLEAKVRQALTVKIGQSFTREQLEQNLNAVKAIGDFSTVEIVPEDTAKGVKISFLVKPYGTLKQVQIKTLPANSSSVLTSATIDEIFQPQYGKQLNEIELKAAIDRLNQLYQKQGYNLAQVVAVEQLDPDGKVTLVIAEGLIEDVQVQFMTKAGAAVDENKKPITGTTRPFIITREAELKPGKIFNRTTAEKDLRRIYGLGLFEDVRVSFAPGSDPAKVILQLNVVERGKSISVYPSFGYSSRDGIFGNLSFSQLNVGGNNQKLNAQAQLGSQNSTTYDLSFADPWIGTDPNRLSYTINAFQQRSLSSVFDGGKTPVFVPGTTDIPRLLRQGGGITFSRPLNGDPFGESTLRGSLGIQYQRVSTTNLGGSIVPKDSGGNDLSFSKTGQDDLLMLQLGLTQDVRNNAADPTQGSLLKMGVDQSIPIGNARISMTKLRGSFTQYVPVQLVNFTPGSQSLLFNVQGGTILGDVPPYEAFSLGGLSSVRGYEDGAVGSGRSYVQAGVEYRFPLLSFLGLGIFADYGSDLGTASSVFGNPAGVRSKPGNGFGYGVGLRVLQTPIGPVRLDYGINNLGETRIQFGLERF
jgi:outer membrane protein insertion porin family